MSINKYIVILLFTVLIFPGQAIADYDPNTCTGSDSKTAEKYFNKAKSYFGKNEKKSKEFLQKALMEDENFADAWYMLADYTNQNLERNRNNPPVQAKIAEQLHKILMKILSICPSYDNYNLNYLVGEKFYKDKDFIKAKEYLSVFIKHADNEQALEIAQNMIDKINTVERLKVNPVPFAPETLEGISTPDDEYLPLISPDGEFIFYTRRYMKDDINSIYGAKSTEEFTVAQRADSTYMHYEKSQAMPSPFNRGNNQGGISITIDNSTLYVTKCEELINYQYRNCDIYVSKRTASGWSELENLGPNINNPLTWESQPSISPDGKTLYFASVRPENIGTTKDIQTSDIYYAEYDESTKSWGKAKNIGAPVNTAGNEKSPFFHADNRTLYFTSDGHKGMGGFDIFLSQEINNQWTEPKNIGYPINTSEDDVGFVVSTKGDRAYFSSNQYKDKGNGGYDIYSFYLHKDARPHEVLFVKGQLVNDKGLAITDAKIKIQNTVTREITEGIVDDESGNYAVAMRINENSDEDFLMVVKRESSSFTSRLIEPKKIKNNQPLNIDVTVQPIETGQAVKLHDIFFDFASSEIMTKSFIVLDNFVEFLNDNPNLSFEIHGHTDNIGNDASNMTLSQERAKAVYTYLISKGIETKRMSYHGFGETQPIADNATESGRAQNRRTEFFIIDN